MRRFVALFLLAISPVWAGGALYFDGTNDWYTCGNYDMNISEEQVSIMAFVTPDFDSTSGTSRGIIGNFDATGCLNGFSLRWRTASKSFYIQVARRTDLGACPPNPPQSVICSAPLAFSAGDLIGVYALTINQEQYLEAYNFTTATAATQCFSSLQTLDIANSTRELTVGWDNCPGCATGPWLGKIHMIILATGQGKNSNIWQLPGLTKKRFFPQWTGTLDGTGSAPAASMDGVWFFESEGATLQTLAGGLTCTKVGNPTPVGSEMQP